MEHYKENSCGDKVGGNVVVQVAAMKIYVVVMKVFKKSGTTFENCCELNNLTNKNCTHFQPI
jgi:hypothetical protein